MKQFAQTLSTIIRINLWWKPRKNNTCIIMANLLQQRFSITKYITSLVAHWNPATTESLISLRYCTPLVQSINKLGPVPSGPKAQILRASVTSYSYFSPK